MNTGTISEVWEPVFTRKHNRVIAIVLVILPAFTILVNALGLGSQLILLVVLVVLTGLPHGALDLTLLRGAGVGSLGMAAALVLYLALAGLVVAGFDTFPAASLCIFLGVAWIHFGLGDTENLSGWPRLGECFARGGLSIAGPLAFHAQDTLGLFTRLCGPGSAGRLAVIVHYFQLFVVPFWLSVSLLMFVLRVRSALFSPPSSTVRNEHFLAAWEMISLFILFWLWPPLAAFGVYFCLVHSVRHLAQIAAAREPRAFRVATRWLWQESWPVVGVTLGLGAALIGHWGGGINPDTLLLRLLFIGLAALTMPHMLLTYWWHRRGEPQPGHFLAKMAS